MKRLIASIFVVALSLHLSAAPEAPEQQGGHRRVPGPQRPETPQRIPTPERLLVPELEENAQRNLIDDRPNAREKLESRRKQEAAKALDEAPAEETDAAAWRAVADAMGKTGEWKGGVYRLVIPRDDLDVTIEGNAVPAAAGIESEFRFYRCPCGRINVVGQFVVADYEANDVIDALRAGHVEIASVGPLLLHERPRLLLVRFFGENHSGGALAKTLRSALAWTGKERMAPRKVE